MRLLSFQGKADRFEWWFITVVGDIAAQVGGIFGFLLWSSGETWDVLGGAGLLLLAAFAFWIVIAVTARRLRERQRPIWLMWLGFVPFVGWLYLLIECGILGPPGSKVKRRVVRRQVVAERQPDEW